MKIYKVLYKEVMVHKFVVPAKSKREAVQHIKDRIFWDLEPYSECSDDDYSVKNIEILKELPESLQHDTDWWNKVQGSRKSWLEEKSRKDAAKQEAVNNKLRTDF